jgi:hypothetical protein
LRTSKNFRTSTYSNIKKGEILWSEQEQLFKLLLEEIQGIKTNMAEELQGIKTDMAAELQGIKTNMATKQDIELINFKLQDIELINTKLDSLSGKIDAQHIENINADNRLLNEIQTLKEGVLFVNRKIADAELEINQIKHKKQ